MESKLNEFKEFIKSKEFLQKKVKSGETSWQELYEHYDLFGEDDELFKEEIPVEKENNTEEKKVEEDKDDTVSSLFGLLSGLDVDKLTDGLNSMKKVLNILSEVTKQDDKTSFSKRKQSRPYQKEDD